MIILADRQDITRAGLQYVINDMFPGVEMHYSEDKVSLIERLKLDLSTGEPAELRIQGRHDPCIAPRACPVQDSLTALVLLDLLTGTV